MFTKLEGRSAQYLPPLLILVLIVGIVYVAKPVLVPLALAVLLAFSLAPVVKLFEWRGLRRVPAVAVTVLITGILFGLVGWGVGAQIHTLASELPTHRKEIDDKLASLRGKGAFSDLLEMLRSIDKGETAADAAQPHRSPREQVVIAEPAQSSLERLATIGPIFEPLAQGALVSILVVFMLIQREDLRNRVIGLLGHGRMTGTTRVFVDSAERVSRFLLTQLVINIGFGVLFALMLFCVGVPYAFLWGFLAVLLRFIPLVGSLVAALLPLVLAFAVAPGWTQPVMVLVFFIILELITSNVVEPLLFAHGTGVSAIALLLAAAFWTWIWGPIGLLLATPMTVCMVVLGQQVPGLRFLSLLLGDQPALDPHASYYQRLLARDAPEAKAVAMRHAQAVGVERVYDEVLLPALRLTRRDRQRGGLTIEDESYVAQATKKIVEELAAMPAVVTEPAAADAPLIRANNVVVIGWPAQNEIEELSLNMLSRLLAADGCRMDVVSTRALPTEIELYVDRLQASLVLIAILPPGGIIQARYLSKRLRKRFKHLPILVGFWGGERNFDKILVRLRTAGASYVTTSLLQSRSQIRALLGASPLSTTTIKAEPQFAPAPTGGLTAEEIAST